MQRIEHREEKWNFKFVEYSPKEKKDNLPLIIQLHGAGERGWGNKDLDLVDKWGFSEYIKDKDYECIFIMPQCTPDTFWVAKIESLLIFIKQIIEEYNVDKDRVYLTGLSMGGFGTWFAAMAEPRLFAAIAPVCGGGMAWNSGVLRMPIWVFHGAEDSTVHPFHSDNMVEKLKEKGADVRYSRIDGVGHNVWLNAYNDDLVKWLLSKKR